MLYVQLPPCPPKKRMQNSAKDAPQVQKIPCQNISRLQLSQCQQVSSADTLIHEQNRVEMTYMTIWIQKELNCVLSQRIFDLKKTHRGVLRVFRRGSLCLNYRTQPTCSTSSITSSFKEDNWQSSINSCKPQGTPQCHSPHCSGAINNWFPLVRLLGPYFLRKRGIGGPLRFPWIMTKAIKHQLLRQIFSDKLRSTHHTVLNETQVDEGLRFSPNPSKLQIANNVTIKIPYFNSHIELPNVCSWILNQINFDSESGLMIYPWRHDELDINEHILLLFNGAKGSIQLLSCVASIPLRLWWK